MNQNKKNNTASETTRTTLFDRIATWLNNLNDPAKVRQNDYRRNASPRALLEKNSFLLFITGVITALIFVAAMTVYYEEKFVEVIAYCFIAAVGFLTLDELRLYRRVIPQGFEARERYLRNLRARLWRGYMRLCRGIARLVWLAIATVAVCIALQFVPNLTEVSPALVEISNWVVDNFNNLLEQGLAYIR